MDSQLIKQILNKDFYEQNKAKLSRSLFDDDYLELYEIITEAHKNYTTDLSSNEVLSLWNNANPVATMANKSAMADVVKKIESEDLINSDVAKDLLAGLWRRDIGRRITNLGIAMSEGKDDAFQKLETLIGKHKVGFLPDDFGPDTTKDLAKLLEFTSDENRFRFNIPALRKRVYGIGRGEFGIIFARPETGKTALGTSLCFAPGGFADQGLKVVMLGNEEATERTMVRVYSSFTGMTKEEITERPDLAVERFELIEDKVSLKSIVTWDIAKVEAYLKSKEPDVVIIDQADKVGVSGNYDAPHLKLRELYTQLRELCKQERGNFALLGMSQASAEAEGKTKVTPDMMEGSKTGKFAEADLIIGVGKLPDNNDGTPDPIRYLTVGKNKLSGWHGTIPVKLEAAISRYED